MLSVCPAGAASAAATPLTPPLEASRTTEKAPSRYCMASMMYHSIVPMVKTPATARPPSPAATSSEGPSAAARRPLCRNGPGANLTPADADDMCVVCGVCVCVFLCVCCYTRRQGWCLLLVKPLAASPIAAECRLAGSCCCGCDCAAGGWC